MRSPDCQWPPHRVGTPWAADPGCSGFPQLRNSMAESSLTGSINLDPAPALFVPERNPPEEQETSPSMEQEPPGTTPVFLLTCTSQPCKLRAKTGWLHLLGPLSAIYLPLLLMLLASNTISMWQRYPKLFNWKAAKHLTSHLFHLAPGVFSPRGSSPISHAPS